jgi:hypothetical protein
MPCFGFRMLLSTDFMSVFVWYYASILYQPLLLFMAKDFESYFIRENIIKLLCKYRLKAAKKKHVFQMIRDVSASERSLALLNHPNNNCPEDLSKLLPPRRQWIRPDRKARNSGTFTDSQKIYTYSIVRKIRSTENAVAEGKIAAPGWLNNLNAFIEKIQARAFNPESSPVKQPAVKPIKKENTKTCKECRPISISDIEDRIVISLTARYFTELFDDHFHDSSFAFRAVRKGIPVRSHHDTIVKVAAFLKRNINKEIFVAECDIMKFFDCINHQLTSDLLKQQAEKHGLKLNKSASTIFDQYLASYSFSKDVFPKNGTDYFDKFGIPGGSFGWKKEKLLKEYYDINEVGENLEKADIGVPQGGAISCFISNLVMHAVDEILENPEDSDLLYMRFCDDMVLLHTDKTKCNEYLEKYKAALKSLKLLVHEPEIIEEYNAKFWGDSTKSKAPYKWADNNVHKANVPWVSFVGYQIRYDGAIRLRKKAFKKEFMKQKEQCAMIARALLVKHKGVLKDINETSKKSQRQQLFALENRLISMSVGRVKLYKLDAKQALCWTNGFKVLNKNKVAARQLRKLDSNRARQLYIFKKKILLLTKPTNEEDDGPDKKKILFGGPYSYHGFLHKMK